MDLKHCLQAACLAHVPVRLVALAAIALVSIAPAAFAEGNDAWGDSSNGYGRYHESNGSAQTGNGWNTSTNSEDRYPASNGSTGSGASTAGSWSQTQ
jgi:hypothetical protein